MDKIFYEMIMREISLDIERLRSGQYYCIDKEDNLNRTIIRYDNYKNIKYDGPVRRRITRLRSK